MYKYLLVTCTHGGGHRLRRNWKAFAKMLFEIDKCALCRTDTTCHHDGAAVELARRP